MRKLPTTLMAAIRRFELAVRQHEMKGSKDPSEFGEIEREYKVALNLLKENIKWEIR